MKLLDERVAVLQLTLEHRDLRLVLVLLRERLVEPPVEVGARAEQLGGSGSVSGRGRAAGGGDAGRGGRPATAQAVERGLRARVRTRVGARAVDLRHPREQSLHVQIEEPAVAEVGVHPATIQHDLPDALLDKLVI